jgi:uncharacterized membrane protein (UPF0127 family)
MKLSINNNDFNVKVMITQNDSQKGMMGKKFDIGYNGMLFMMGQGTHCFWMKDCITSLDIIFIKGNKISKIYHNSQPCNSDDCENYCGEGDLVLELKGDTCKSLSINIGDEIIF